MSCQIQANSRGDRGGAATGRAKNTSMVSGAGQLHNTAKKAELPGVADNGAEYRPQPIDGRWANLPIYDTPHPKSLEPWQHSSFQSLQCRAAIRMGQEAPPVASTATTNMAGVNVSVAKGRTYL